MRFSVISVFRVALQFRQISLQSSGSAAARADVADAIQVGFVHDVQISSPGLDLTQA
jgi:hypothetical protein